jgi:hypothetical protein
MLVGWKFLILGQKHTHIHTTQHTSHTHTHTYIHIHTHIHTHTHTYTYIHIHTHTYTHTHTHTYTHTRYTGGVFLHSPAEVPFSLGSVTASAVRLASVACLCIFPQKLCFPPPLPPPTLQQTWGFFHLPGCSKWTQEAMGASLSKTNDKNSSASVAPGPAPS